MNIYCAHPFTREYVGQSLADTDPLEPENWLIPAHAYLDPPPAPVAGQAVVRSEDGAVWQLVADHRGTVYDTITGNPQQHDELGDLPDNLTAEPRPSPFHVWTSGAWMLNAEAQSDALRGAERDWRNAMLLKAYEVRDRHRDEVDLSIPTTITSEQFREHLDYIQQLRTWPQSSLFPSVEHRPYPPAWVIGLVE